MQGSHLVDEFAHVLRTGARRRLVGHRVAHSTRSFWNNPPSAISISDTVQLPPISCGPVSEGRLDDTHVYQDRG